MPRIFISYRRDDSLTVTGRLHDHLVSAFGAENVFKDVDDIPLGVDFRRVVEREVSACDVLLVIIGSSWLTVNDDSGRRRLDLPEDFVRVEVEEGLKRPNVLVVPVLVNGANMPGSAELPSTLRELAFRNAALIRDDPDFSRDMQRLIAKISNFRGTNVSQAQPTPAPLPAREEFIPRQQPAHTEVKPSAQRESRTAAPVAVKQKSGSRSWAGLSVLVLIVATALYLAFQIMPSQGALVCGGTTTGTITADNPVQRFEFQRDAGAPFMVTMYRTGEENPLDPFMMLEHPSGGTIAEAYNNAEDGNARLVLPGLPDTGTYTLKATSHEEASEGAYALRTYCEPRPVGCNSVVSGQISAPNPIDWWVLDAEPGLNVTVRMIKADEGNLDPALFVHAPEGWLINYDDDSLGEHNAVINFWTEQPGPYSILAARFQAESGDTNGFYELEVVCNTPQQQQQ